ncbi:hypothetical protein Ancab_038729 [Ancistrocladus abbreviatus]
MESDEEDFVFVGTPIEREEEIASRKKKAVAEASGNLRGLPSWKQEVRDEEGRRRFHGAFTGGFSAGYYNTVGSKEGWTPQSFTSSRKNRAEIKQQSILNFLDEDEKAEMEGQLLGTSSQFDTFGFTAAELTRKQVEKEQSQRPSAIPGPVPDELIVPAAESIGVKLLLKMGWRHGRPIKDQRNVRREARKAFLALSSDDVNCVDGPNAVKAGLKGSSEKPVDTAGVQSSECTPVYVNSPKQDLHGLGFDPYKHAPEFRENKRSRLSVKEEIGKRKPLSMGENLYSSKSGKVAPGFGIGALEELDIEDEDVYGSGYDYEETYVQEDEEPSRLTIDNMQIVDNKRKLTGKQEGVLPGFRVATKSDYQLERFDPPAIPEGFVPHHKFSAPLNINSPTLDLPPPEVPPPEDNNLRVMIDGVAALVARSGKLFEDISREKNQSNPLFNFLSGGSGCDYYARKLWEEQQKRNDQSKSFSFGKLFSGMPKMTAESRGRILGERPLERSSKDSSSSVASADFHVHSKLSDTFMKPESFAELLETAMPFKDDPAKQERFKQFLKDKYQGGLRSAESGGAGNMSETARARERLDFEAAAEAIEKAKLTKQMEFSAQQLMEFKLTAGLQFTSGGAEPVKVTQAEDSTLKKLYPKREQFQWRPAPLLCKRFDIVDPFMGKPPPAPRMRSKLDSVIFGSEFVTSKETEEVTTSDDLSVLLSNAEEIPTKVSNGENEDVMEVENVERPVDLYKAIFADDSDDEGEGASNNQAGDAQKKIEAANTTLSRLIAGDFLESLGKELGLEVPPDLPVASSKARTAGPQKDVNTNAGVINPAPIEDMPFATFTAVDGLSGKEGASQSKAFNQAIVDETPKAGANVFETASLREDTAQVTLDKIAQEGRKAKSSSIRHNHHSARSSSEDERSKKHSRRHNHRSSDTDSSDDYGEQYHSRSRDRKRRSSREESDSREHSKHKRSRGGSPVRSSHRKRDKDGTESKKETRRHKRRD